MAREDNAWMDDAAEQSINPQGGRPSDVPVDENSVEKLYRFLTWGRGGLKPPPYTPTPMDNHREEMFQHERNRLNAPDDYEYESTQRSTERELNTKRKNRKSK